MRIQEEKKYLIVELFLNTTPFDQAQDERRIMPLQM